VEVVVGETTWLPDVALDPLQAFEAVQDVALVEVQDRVEEPPLLMVVGLAFMSTVGGLALVVTDSGGVLLADSLPALS
jgi:hypothetical protein